MTTPDQGLIVMYHYIRPDSSRPPAGIRPLWVSEFEQQLDWLEERYDLISATAFLSRLQELPSGNRKPPCLLTFDDGTKDHATIVTPILARRKLSGLFFVLSWPAELLYMPLTHAVHWMLGEDEDCTLERLERFARDHLGGPQALGDPAEAMRVYSYESPARARIKYAVNMALPMGAAEQFIHNAVHTAGISMEELAAEWFVSADDIRMMHAAGMSIGSHGCSHRGLSVIGNAGMRSEVHHSADYIAGLIGIRPTWFACPFGGSGAALNEISTLHDDLQDAGFVAAVSTVKTFVPLDADLYALPRFDTIDLPPRRSAW